MLSLPDGYASRYWPVPILLPIVTEVRPVQAADLLCTLLRVSRRIRFSTILSAIYRTMKMENRSGSPAAPEALAVAVRRTAGSLRIACLLDCVSIQLASAYRFIAQTAGSMPEFTFPVPKSIKLIFAPIFSPIFDGASCCGLCSMPYMDRRGSFTFQF